MPNAIKEKKMKAIFNGKIIAESDNIISLEENYYFPKDSINSSYFQDSTTKTICPWKGTASYYNIIVENDINNDAAWYYEKPQGEAKEIKDRVAFWRGVKFEE